MKRFSVRSARGGLAAAALAGAPPERRAYPERRACPDVYLAGTFGSYLADPAGSAAGPAERRPLRGLTIGATRAADARAMGGPFGSRPQPGHTTHAPPPPPLATTP
jgi:hypothetical protein